MADLGYDVYIGNNRGTKFSQDHTIYAYDSSEYWNYTLDGYAEDLLANIRGASFDFGKFFLIVLFQSRMSWSDSVPYSTWDTSMTT